MSRITSKAGRWRALAAGVAGLGATTVLAATVLTHGSPTVAVYLPLVALVSAAVLAHVRRLGAQLLARAVWWANLVFGAFLCATSSGTEREIGVCLALGCGAALIIIGNTGLAEASARDDYSPVAFQTTLTLAMLLSLADTQTLVLFGLLMFKGSDKLPTIITLFVCAGVMIVAFVGLYLIRTWGVIATVVANVLIAALALSGVLDLRDSLVALLVTTAVVQLIVPMPMFVAMARKKPLPWRPSQRTTRLAATTAVALLMAVSAYAEWIHDGRLLSL